MKIAVVGLGYVGAVTAACLAKAGHDVVGVDIDPYKVDLIRSGRSPIVEEGLDELIAAGAAAGRLRALTAIPDLDPDVELFFVSVGTPSTVGGRQDTSIVEKSARELGDWLRTCSGRPTIVLRSTVPPGTTRRLFVPEIERTCGRRAGDGWDLCYQPEFLREGSSIDDFFTPPFTIVGADREQDAATVRAVYGSFPAEFIVTTIEAAELMKLACNAFHATKVTFANEIGRIARAVGADGRQVMDLLCRDKVLNISPAYMRPGFAFGGSCLPKDVRALSWIGNDHGLEVDALGALLESNRHHIEHALAMIRDSGARRIGQIGLCFKKGTDDLRESPLVALAEALLGKGVLKVIVDTGLVPDRLIGANKAFVERWIPQFESLLVGTPDDALAVGLDGLVIGHGGADSLAAARAMLASGGAVIDLVGLAPLISERPPRYHGVCW